MKNKYGYEETIVKFSKEHQWYAIQGNEIIDSGFKTKEEAEKVALENDTEYPTSHSETYY